MKRCPRFARTVEFLKKNPHKVEFFNDHHVHIYSGEYGLFWRSEQAGHTALVAEAGVYLFKEAWHYLQTCGPEKKLSVQIVSDEHLMTLSNKYSKCVNAALHGTDEQFRAELEKVKTKKS